MSESQEDSKEPALCGDYRDLAPTKTEKRIRSKRLKGLPTVTAQNGVQFKLSESDLERIEYLSAHGADVSFIAQDLKLTQREFQLAVDNSSLLELALRNGMAQDKHELELDCRERALAGSVQHFNWYMRNKHGSLDNRGDGKQGSTVAVVQVVTGIERSLAPIVERSE